jgi:hypothetical protein
MIYTLLAVFIVSIALFFAYQSLKFLWLNSWFLGLIKGLFGLSLLALAIGFGLLATDIYSYKQVLLEQPVATITFDEIESQYFNAEVVDSNGNQKRFKLRGDQWQLDARIIKWKGYLSGFGIKPAYRLDRLSGRYYDIEKETKEVRTAYAIASSYFGLDLWRLFQARPQWFPIVDAHYGSATYLPMKKGALYEITLSNTGLVARPLNSVANDAIAEWK